MRLLCADVVCGCGVRMLCADVVCGSEYEIRKVSKFYFSENLTVFEMKQILENLKNRSIPQ